ncbi:hypothetical protein DITRI_Ditri01bG0003000 [Diplodiscus trichospermus]
MALVLFGCWAHFAKDSAEIRYLVLSSIVSSSVLEVKASLFAAGCFCELAEDFASVVLEMLVNLMASLETPPAVRLAGASVFTRMICLYSVSSRAYKAGVKLVSDSSDENFIIAMLVSLSKLVSKSTGLISEQVDLLLSCLSQENTLQLRVTALSCLHRIFVKEGCCSPVNMHVIKTLFGVLDESELPSVVQCGALQILHKILMYTLPNLPSFEMLEFAKHLIILENASQSPIMSKSLVALRVMTDVSTKLWARIEGESFAVCSSPLPSRVISLIMAKLSSLVKPLPDHCQTNSRTFQEVKSLLNLILQLVGEHPDLGVMVLDKVSSLIEYFANLNESSMAVRQIGSSEILGFEGEKFKVFRSKLLFIINRFLAACLQNLNKIGAITTNVFDKVKLLVEHLHHGRVFDSYTHTIYSLLLHYCLVGNSDIFCIAQPFKQELAILEHACKMLSERDNWLAYKAGTYAACQGAWITATFIFAHLMTRVQSDSCYCWFESLVQFSYSEAKVHLNVLAKQQSILVGSLDMNELLASLKDNLGEIGQDAARNISEPNYRDVLLGAYHNQCSSIETLGRVVLSRKAFCFQRWFFALRTRFLRAAWEMLEVLDASKEENFSNIIEVQKSVFACLKHLQQCTQLSFRLKRIAKELDLISSSFIGMDSESSKIVAAFAFNCSVLAFTAGFPLFFPNLPTYKNSRTCDHGESHQKYSHSMLVQDLLGRLLHIDHEISIDLCLLLDNGGHTKNGFHWQLKNHILKSGHEVRDILNVIKNAVSAMFHLQSETNRMQNEAIIFHVTKNGLELLSNTIKTCLQIPFHIPKYFFKTRPLFGSELFVFDTDARNQNEIIVLPGFHLSLNLCLQLRNASPEFSLQLTKLYCLLHCRVSFQRPSHSERNHEQMEWDCQPWESEDMVEMNEKLFHYVTECGMKRSYGKHFWDNDIKDEQIANGFVCFKPNAKGQGFSSCVLDVSRFPEGCYRVKWYSCCIDNQGSYWSLLPLNCGPVFTVQKSHVN